MSRTGRGMCVVALATAIAVAAVGCVTQHERPAPSTLGCAEAVVDQLPPGLTDPEKHCLASALLVQQCSRFESWLAGWGKEIEDALGEGDADWDDLRSDRLGRKCAAQPGDTDQLLACCRQALTEPVETLGSDLDN